MENSRLNALKSIAVLFLLFTIGGTSVSAQNISINTDGAAPDNSAMLDVYSTTQGILVPRMDSAQRAAIPNPANGLLVYQTNLDSGFYFNAGTAAMPNWLRLTSQGDSTTNLAKVLSNGNNAEEDSIFNLNALTIGSQRIPKASLEIDSVITISGNISGLNLFGSNIYNNGTSIKYLNNGSADAFAAEGGVSGIFHWPAGIATNNLPSDPASFVRLEDTAVIINGDYSNFAIRLKGNVKADSLRVNNAYSFPYTAPNAGEIMQYNGSNLVWAAGGGISDLSTVLGNGNDARADSILNLGTLSLGSQRAPVSTIEVDSFVTIRGDLTGNVGWLGFNAYRTNSGVSKYLNTGYADGYAAYGNSSGIYHWIYGTAGNPLPAVSSSVRLEDAKVVVTGASTLAIDLEGVVTADSLRINGNYSFPRSAGNTGEILLLNGTDLEWATVSGSGDNLGNHTATTNLQLGTNYLSGDGGNEGIRIDGAGNVGIGTAGPRELLEIRNDGSYDNFLRINSGTAAGNFAGIKLFEPGSVPFGWKIQMDASNDRLAFTQQVNALTEDEKVTFLQNGNVGIGVTLPGEKLEVDGSIEIPAANDYKYSTAKTHYQSFAPTAFRSLNPENYEFGTDAAANFWAEFRNGSSSQFGYATVAVHLPDGAVVDELEGWIWDNSNSTPVRIGLHRQALGSSAVGGAMVEIESILSYAATGIRNLTSNTVNNSTIDNENYSYFLFFTGRRNSSDTRLYGAKITYTVTEAD